jgi:hypothetical protein
MIYLLLTGFTPRRDEPYWTVGKPDAVGCSKIFCAMCLLSLGNPRDEIFGLHAVYNRHFLII